MCYMCKSLLTKICQISELTCSSLGTSRPWSSCWGAERAWEWIWIRNEILLVFSPFQLVPPLLLCLLGMQEVLSEGHGDFSERTGVASGSQGAEDNMRMKPLILSTGHRLLALQNGRFTQHLRLWPQPGIKLLLVKITLKNLQLKCANLFSLHNP